MNQKALTLPAFAKINLSLRVLGKRDDGYHEIETVLQTISLRDTITFQSGEDGEIRLSVDDRSIPGDEKNLVWRAAAALRERSSERLGARIRLEKRIPHEAGLGGGSSDAAVTLIALAYLWNIEVERKDLLNLAEGLGADAPFFLFGGTAHGIGRGSEVTPTEDAGERHLLVLKPNASVPTSKAYQTLNRAALTSSDSKIILSSSRADRFSAGNDLNALHNDFEVVVFKLATEIERAKAALLRAGATTALLAGSGSAVFGVFDNQDAQERAIQAIELETGWRAFPCKTVGRNDYRRASG